MKLNGKIDEIVEHIIDGKTFRQIAELYDVTIGTVHNFLTLEENAVRAKAALQLSATSYADKGDEILLNCKGTKEEIMRARELAQHYRWKAAKRSPKEYGERVTHDGNINLTNEPVKFE